MTLCGLLPAIILHHLPTNQRYGYLAYPAIYVAAAEGTMSLAAISHRFFRHARVSFALPSAQRSPNNSAISTPLLVPLESATLAVVCAFHIVQANVDLWGLYGIARGFGAP